MNIQSLARFFHLFLVDGTWRRLLSNSGWLLFDQFLRVAAGALLSLWVARHYGPTRLGEFSYAMAIAALWAPLALTSLDTLVIRDLVKDKSSAPAILASAHVLRLFAALLSMGGALVMSITIQPEDRALLILVLLAALATTFQSAFVIDGWYQSQNQTRIGALARSLAFVIGALVRIVAVAIDANVTLLAVAVAVEALVAGIIFHMVYHKKEGHFLDLRAVDWSRIRGYLFEGKSLILTGVLIGIYMRVDRVMIGSLLDSRSVGIYSVAAQLCELFYLLPTAVLLTIYPMLVSLHAANKERYQQRLLQVMAALFYGGLAIAVFFSIASPWIIEFLLGPSYKESADISRIYIFLLPLISISIVFSHWYVLHEKTAISMYGTVIGSVSALLLNYLLIQRFGLPGAAYAALISMLMPTLIVSLFFDRQVGIIFLDAIRLRFGIRNVV
jgi:O-antigen/teichoic acid export membrane protein